MNPEPWHLAPDSRSLLAPLNSSKKTSVANLTGGALKMGQRYLRYFDFIIMPNRPDRRTMEKQEVFSCAS